MERARGFTLLEVMVALLIVGAVGLGMVASVAADSRAACKSASELEALTIAEEILAQINTMADSERSVALAGTATRLPPPSHGYSWRIESRAVAGEPGLLDVAVFVTGPESEVILNTRRFEPASARANP